MGRVADELGYRVLRRMASGAVHGASGRHAESTDAGIEAAFGKGFFDLIQGKTVIDFGCGLGQQSVEMAKQGAAKVIGLDVQTHFLAMGRQHAARAGVSDRCEFTVRTQELADVIVSKDAFEHYADPAAILATMATLLKPDGCVLASFGPTWLHPYGGHIFSIFPWSHLMFTEASQIRWRADFKQDGATRFSEVAGGLNQLTIARFEALVAHSPFRLEALQTVPIKGLPLFKTRMFREFGSSIVRCKLVLKSA
jgi:SAM-dependent methyltransferase